MRSPLSSARTRRAIAALLAAICVAILSALGVISPFGESVGEPAAPSATSTATASGVSAAATSTDGAYLVTKVVDGDTIRVDIDGVSVAVRYIGIDTPETVHPSKPVECFGVEASKKNAELVAGKRVRLQKDVSDTDRYGRLLRHVFVGDTHVNLALVAEGYAHASSYPPDVAFDAEFLAAERAAREAGLGLWGTSCARGEAEG